MTYDVLKSKSPLDNSDLQEVYVHFEVERYVKPNVMCNFGTTQQRGS